MKLQEIYESVSNRLNKAGVDGAELDTSVIISHVLGQDKTFILSHPEFELGESEKRKILRLANQRSKSVPIAYLTSHKEFFGYDFLVDKRVLIPRPETEFLVEQALVFVRSRGSVVGSSIHHTPNSKLLTILDVGTGSGCIIISLIKSLRTSEPQNLCPYFYASDISEQALTVAKENAKIHGVENRINFLRSDLFSNPRLPKKFDLIIANLPYVPRQVRSRESGVESIDFEPQDAIFADDNGASIIKKFLLRAADRLTPHGAILIELDPRNANEINKIAVRYFPTANIELTKDLANLDRYLVIQT